MDRIAAMAMFVRVVESGSFSAVARELDTTQPNVSKLIRALEARLGGRLLARSTRRLSLTDEGRRYYEDCRRILEAVDAAEHSFQTGRERVAGPLRVAAPVSFGRRRIAARLGDFLARHPQVAVELLLSDDNTDLVAEGIDVALRLGPLADSGLIARALGHGLTPGEADFPLRSGRQGALGNGGDVFRQMHARQFLVFCLGRYMQTGLRQLRSNPVAQQAVLGHGKAVPLGQRQYKFIGVIGIHDVIVATRAFPGGLPLICCIATKNTCNHTIAA